MPRPGQRGAPWPWAIALVGALLFGSTWSDAVQEGPGGAWITAACNGWSAPPPGAALLSLLGRVACELPVGSGAGRMALLSAACAVACMLLLYGLVRRATGNGWAGAMAAFTLGTGDIFWREASRASAATLTTCLCLAALYCVVRGVREARSGWFLPAGLAAGLAAAAQLAALSILPLVLLASLRPLRPVGRTAVRLALTGAGLAAGLALAGWTPPLPPLASEPLAALGKLVAWAPTQTAGVLWPLGLLGLGILCFHAAGRPLGSLLQGRLPRDLAGLLAAAPLLAGPLLLLAFALKDPAQPWRLARPGLLVAFALFCAHLGVGLALLDTSLLGRGQTDEATGRRRGTAWRLIGLAVVGIFALVSYPRARLDNDFLVEDHAVNSLAAAERGAVLLVRGETQRASFLFAQQVLRMRPDVEVLDPSAMAARPDPLRLVQRRMRQGRPVHLAALLPDRRLRNAFGTYPAGPLLRIQPPDRKPPSAATLQTLNRRLFRGFSRRGLLPHQPDALRATDVLEPYSRAWQTVGRELFARGDTKAAFRALVRAQRWAPWMEVPGWFAPRKAGRAGRAGKGKP